MPQDLTTQIIFQEYSEKTDLPKPNDDERREAKIQFLSKL